jgi:phosphate transport system protein
MNEKNILQRELDKLRHDILAMASRVEEDIGKALTALRNGDKELAKEVKADDKIVNDMQKKIEDEAAVLMATQHPVAGDLRESVTIFKIAGNLERIGDYAVHLAKAASKLSGEPSFRSLEHIEKMAETGQEMLRLSVSAFLAKDTKAARNVAGMDQSIDEQHKLLTEEVLGFIKEKKGAVKKAVRLLNTSGYLERMGDHIKNICESIIYMVEAKHEELN